MKNSPPPPCSGCATRDATITTLLAERDRAIKAPSPTITAARTAATEENARASIVAFLAAEAKRQQDEIEWAKAAAAKAAADILAAEKAEADRVEQARIQAAAEAAKQAEELAERLKREANTPQAGEIVTLIADHYRISNGAALDWLRGMFGDVRQAA